MQKLLIANRGEIAVRIMRAARELGLRTVAVYSTVDREAPHTHSADEAFCLGPPEPARSYLDVARILEAARVCGADAVHPGYGFLSENAGFAEACEQAGLIFVGPRAAAIRDMGSKIVSKRIAERAGLPVIPSFQAADDATLVREAPAAAEQLGYPILVKAAAGGGGKGMRVIEHASELLPALEAGAREARQAFGDATLLLEKYICRPRHVEVQVLGDNSGNLLHVFERECSVQRRHQKIIEETPSPAINADLRQRMTDAALRLADAVRYTSAGTVEFLLAPDGTFYFLEMNTRLQVEHAITELVSGVDLVHQQLRIAGGEPLAFTQSQLTQRGHAIECRLYAENPANGFLPATGRVHVLREPHRPGSRVDSGLALHQEITPHYDPILAKLITHGATREEARLRMRALLRDYVVLGLTTNREFLLDAIESEAFAAGDTDTTFIERHFPDWRPASLVPTEVLAIAALGDLLQQDNGAATPVAGSRSADPAVSDPWMRRDGWRVGALQ